MCRLIASGLVLTALAACQATQTGSSGQDPGGTADVQTTTAAPDELVFRLLERPGLAPPGAGLAMPAVSLYGDGRLIVAEPAQGVRNPARPSIPAVRLRRVTPAGVHKIVAAAGEAGLTARVDYGRPGIVDGPSTTFTLVTDGQRHQTTVSGLSMGADGLTSAQQAARTRLRAFAGQLTSLDTWLGGDIGKDAPYAYPRLAVFALPDQPATAGGPQRDWPLKDLGQAGEPFDLGRCFVVTGRDLATVQAATDKAGADTLWRGTGGLFHLTFRPLLPDERDCASLEKR
jgi:hypothetical protein